MRYLKKQTTNQSSLNGRGIKYSAQELATIDSESALLLPKGSTGARPSPVEGMIRYNTTTQSFEAYENDAAFGTPNWKRFRTDTPKTIHVQNLGNGDSVESLFGPLDANDPVSPVPSAPAQILCMVENVLQIPTTNYIFTQNPCYHSSDQISFWADISTSGKTGAGAFNPGTSAAFSNDVATVNFATRGFYVGQTIFVSDSTNNNGFYTVASVSSTFLEINETFINENDPGYGTTETIEGLVNQSVETGTFSQTLDSTADVIVLNNTTLTTIAADGSVSIEDSTVTLTFAPQATVPFTAGQTIIVSGITPAGYNGTHVVTFCNLTTVKYANGNATTGAQTVPGTITGNISTMLDVDNMIVFDTTTGNIVAGTVYFVKTINSGANQITISATAGGATFDLGDASTPGNWCAGVGYGRQPSVIGRIASATTAGSNLITLNDTTSMAVGQEISFTGTEFGNLVEGQIYYIVNIASPTLQISTTYSGPVFSLTTATGYMQVATLGNNLYVSFGTPVPAGKPVTILHNFDK